LEHFGGAWVDENKPPLGVQGDESVRDAFEDVGDALVGLLQLAGAFGADNYFAKFPRYFSIIY
jgi:hypothetical protein